MMVCTPSLPHAYITGDFGVVARSSVRRVLQEGKGAWSVGSSTYSYWDEDDILERVMFDRSSPITVTSRTTMCR
jgi:hypothetical protein